MIRGAFPILFAACCAPAFSQVPPDCHGPAEIERALAKQPSADAYNALGAWFAERRIYVSLRGTKMRIAPHLYVRPADVERFVAATVEAGLI